MDDEGRKPEHTYIFLRPAVDKEGNPVHRVFYCPFCRNGVLKVSGRVAMVMPGNDPFTDHVMKTPFEVICGGKDQMNGRCNARFSIEGFVEK